MTHAWLLLLVDPAEPITCQVRTGGEIQVTHLRHAAWLLDRHAEVVATHTTGRSSFEGVSWTDEHQVCVLEWHDDCSSVRFHGKPMSVFHLTSAAEHVRERAGMPGLQQAVLGVLQSFAAAQAEGQAAAQVARQVNGDGAVGGKIILLGR